MPDTILLPTSESKRIDPIQCEWRDHWSLFDHDVGDTISAWEIKKRNWHRLHGQDFSQRFRVPSTAFFPHAIYSNSRIWWGQGILCGLIYKKVAKIMQRLYEHYKSVDLHLLLAYLRLITFSYSSYSFPQYFQLQPIPLSAHLLHAVWHRNSFFDLPHTIRMYQ